MSTRVVASLNVRDMVTASRGLLTVSTTRRNNDKTHLAGQPSVKFVFAIRVAWSNISSS